MYSQPLGCCSPSGDRLPVPVVRVLPNRTPGRATDGVVPTWNAQDYRAWGGMGPGGYAGPYGQESSGDGGFVDVIRDALPQLESWSQLAESVSDPARQVAVLRSQLQAALASGASLQKIELLKGKLAAAEARLQRQQETSRSVRMWRSVGMLAAVSGVALLGAITFSVLAKTLWNRRKR